jgi:hypothetical protein
MIIICCLPSLPVEIFWHLLTPLQHYICAYVTTRDVPPQLAAAWVKSSAIDCAAARCRPPFACLGPVSTGSGLSPVPSNENGASWEAATWTGSPEGRVSWEDQESKRMEPSGMEPSGMQPLGSERHGWADAKGGEATSASAPSTETTAKMKPNTGARRIRSNEKKISCAGRGRASMRAGVF